nr:RYamide receptor [Leptinotarsa decemlineata]
MDFNETRNITDCENFIMPESPLRNPYFQGSVYSMYVLIFVVAFVGNSFICYVVVSSPRMHTVTNFFIMNLAVGDMLIIVLCVPFTSVSLMQQYWPFGGILCPVVNYSQALSVFISAYTLVAISIDKYMVIMWPLKPRITKGFAISMIALVWMIAGTTVLPSAFFAKIIQPDYPYVDCDRYICREDFSRIGQEYEVLYSKILMVFQYVIPSIVLIFTYTSIAVVIWCHRIPGEAENSRDMRIAKSKRKVGGEMNISTNECQK